MARVDEAVVVLTVKIRKPGVRRKVASGDVRVRSRKVELDDEAQDPDEDSISVTKSILASVEYEEICAHDSSIRAYLRSQALPTRLAGGQYLIPVALIERVDQRVGELAAEREKLVSRFVDAYPKLMEAARGTLGDLFDEKDYASPGIIGDAFELASTIGALEMPGQGLARVSSALYSRELKKVEAARDKMVHEIRDGLRYAAGELVTQLASRLTASDEGKPKVLTSQIEKLRAFIKDFASLNVSGDSDLERLVKEAGELVEGVTPKNLRASATTREALGKNLARIGETLDGMISADPVILRADRENATALELEPGRVAPREIADPAQAMAQRLANAQDGAGLDEAGASAHEAANDGSAKALGERLSRVELD